MVLGQTVGSHHHRHPAGNLAHRLEQRQASIDLNRLVSQPRHPAFHQRFSQCFVGSEVQVGEKNLAFAQERNLVRLRFLHLDDQIRIKHRFVCVYHRRAGRLIVGIRIATICACPAFDQHLVSALLQLIGRGRQQRDPMLLLFNLPGDSNFHKGNRTLYFSLEHQSTPVAAKLIGRSRYQSSPRRFSSTPVNATPAT